MHADIDILKNGLLFMLHLAAVSERFLANLVVFRCSKPRRLTVSTFPPILRSRKNFVHNGTSAAARLLGETIYPPQKSFHRPNDQTRKLDCFPQLFGAAACLF